MAMHSVCWLHAHVDAKKTKLSDNSQPSRVLHVRSLPAATTEFEVAALAAPFGRVTNIMLLRQRNQALMELEDEAIAATCCNYYNYTPAMIRYVIKLMWCGAVINPELGRVMVDIATTLHDLYWAKKCFRCYRFSLSLSLPHTRARTHTHFLHEFL